MALSSSEFDIARAKQEKSTGKRKPGQDQPLTSEPLGTPSPEQRSFQTSFSSTVPGTTRGSNSPDSFCRVVSEEALSAQHSRQESEVPSVRSRTSSFAEKVSELGSKVFGKGKSKRNRHYRDRSARPSRPDVLDKEHTSKLTKFWHTIFNSEGTSLTSIPEQPPPPSRWLRRKALMDRTRLAPAPEAVDGEKKQRAIQDAKDMYQLIRRNCERTSTEIPPYDFIELIGKGMFGRVYKCRRRGTGELVAIKIVNTDDIDFAQNTLDKDDTLRDFRKEVSILQQLKDSNAKNVNMIHEAFDLQEQLWIICDYCTGGSIRTLLRPSAASRPGLDEQYIIPIARELAIAIQSVHDIGVIHRDIKCANVYITEEGHLQLGDFGIVGVLDDEGTKRRTIVGTPHYMSKEMLSGMSSSDTNQGEAYGKEVDIWSFGCTVYEMATGQPPNVTKPQELLPSILVNAPRLGGGDHSQDLRDFIAFCLNSDPQQRPTAEAVLKHPYVAGTQKRYPTKSLVNLIERYKIWEYGGGWRHSLFMAGGAPPVSSPGGHDILSEDEDYNDWNFSTSDGFNADFERRYSQMVLDRDVPDIHLETTSSSDLPPIVTKDLTPLEQVQQQFQNLSASRGERSLGRLWNPGSTPYELHTPVDDDQPHSDLPFRNMPGAGGARESTFVIDLDSAASMDDSAPTFNFDFSDMPTMKATTRTSTLPSHEHEEEDESQFGRSENDLGKRATMDWKFPTAKRATMDWRFPTTKEPREPDDPNAKMNLPPVGDGAEVPAGFRPTLKHTATVPIGQFRDFIHPARPVAPASASPVRESMIDLDIDLGDPDEIPRPGTATSATGSTMTDMTSGNPFDLEEDPEQNEIDRNRFSYHRQYRSEGGQMRRGSRRSVPMHNRGNSLSSTDTDDDMLNYEYNRKLSESMGHELNGSYDEPDSVDLDNWPHSGAESRFDGVRPYNGDFNTMIRQQQPRMNGHSFAPLHDTLLRGQGEVEFPQPTAPHAHALLEDADPRLVASELDRLLDDLGDSLKATSRALQQSTDVYVEDEEAEGGSGMESNGIGTGKEEDTF